MPVVVPDPTVRSRSRGVRFAAAACAAVGLVVAGCARAPGAVPVPSYPPPSATTTATAPPVARGLPGDCADLVGNDELPALFGLPLGSVRVATVLGQPAPSVGRLQRIDCLYTLTDPAAPPGPGVVLRMTVGVYRDPPAARDQHDRNVADQQAGGASRGQPELGSATASLVQRGVESVLLVSYSTLTLDLDLPRPVGRLAASDLLTDLARRVLARLGPALPPVPEQQ